MNTTITTHEQKHPVQLSKRGMKELKKSISQLEHDRDVVIRSLHELDKTTGHDDRLERIERLAQLEAIESELVEKKQMLATATLIPSRRERMNVALGSVVDLIDQQGQLFRYTIVNSLEANPSDGRISIASPLGKSLIGKSPQETVNWQTVVGSRSLQLVKIS